MKKELLVVCMGLISGIGVEAQSNSLALPGQSQLTQEVDGRFRLESVSCANGNLGELRYESASLRLEFGEISSDLIKDGCEINVEGSFTLNDKLITTEFTSGTWATCSGTLPTYILNRFEFRRDRDALFLTGNDLTPFAHCSGEGELHFVAE